MRTSKDQYKTIDGAIIEVGCNEQPPEGATIWNGYDYQKQCWIFEGQKDERSLEQLQAINESAREQAKQFAISDAGLTEDEAEAALEDGGFYD